MNYTDMGKYKLEYKIPKYACKILSEKYTTMLSPESISLSIPFGISIVIQPEKKESEIAKEVIIKLIDRRILNAKECCGSCIKKSLASLMEIKGQLIDIKVKLANKTDSALFYLIDYIIISINTFLDFIERYKIEDEEQNKAIYFDALEKIRSHISQCMFEIAKIGKFKIDRNHYAFKEGD